MTTSPSRAHPLVCLIAMILQDVKRCSPSGETRTWTVLSAGAGGIRTAANNPAEQFRLFLRPDAALFRSPPRSWFGRWWNRRADCALANILDSSDITPNTPDSLVYRCLAWQYKYVLPVYQGRADAPQQASETLRTMSGDCEDGAILLMCLILTLLPVSEWPRLSLVVGSIGGWRSHCWLLWRDSSGAVVSLDTQQQETPIADGMWRIDGAVTV